LFNRDNGSIVLVTFNWNNTGAAPPTFSSPSPELFQEAISGDGRYVAYLTDARDAVKPFPLFPDSIAPQLYLRDMTGKTNIWLTRTASGVPAKSVSSPELSTNGTVLAFLSTSLGVSGSGDQQFIYLYNTASRELKQAAAADEFRLSSDGQWLAYASTNQIYLYDIAAGTNRLVSAAANGSAGAGPSSTPLISADGSKIIFSSAATNLPGESSGGFFQLYSFDRASGKVALLTSSQTNLDGSDSDVAFAALSADGSTAGFMSFATDLVANDDKGVNDVFAVPTSGLGLVTLVSVPDPSAGSSTANNRSDFLGGNISADGRYVVFTSVATDLVPNDDNGVSDVFLRDRQTGTTKLVSISSDGVHPMEGGGVLSLTRSIDESNMSISADGKTVLFAGLTRRTDATLPFELYAYDVEAGTNRAITLLPTNGTSGAIASAALSANGRYAAYVTSESHPKLFLNDLLANTTNLVSSNSAVEIAAISPNGRYLVTSGFGGGVYDLVAGKFTLTPLGTSLVSVNDKTALEMVGNGPEDALATYTLESGVVAPIATNFRSAAQSPDGSLVVFQSGYYTNEGLVVYHTETRLTTPLTLNGTNLVFRIKDAPIISSDNRYIAFVTENPLAEDASGIQFNDVYVYDLALTNLVLVSHTSSGSSGDYPSNEPYFAAGGSLLAFQSAASDLVPNDRNRLADIFVAHMPLTDANQNGIDDGWEIQHFGSTTADANADTDQDGMSNLQEFLAGTDPANAQSSLALTAASTAGAGESQTLSLEWSGVAGKSYQVQFLSALGGTWQNAGNAMTAISPGQTMTAEAPIAASGNGFYRVIIAGQ
jgi:Tol biopolymer transport system component